MGKIVFIPSYGTDASLYDQLKKELEVRDNFLFVEWLPISKRMSLEDYAASFIEKYGITSEDIMVGVSFGGMLAIEIDKIKPLTKVILISSIKSKKEKPILFRILAATKGYKLFNPNLIKIGLDFLAPFYGKNISKFFWFRKVFKATDNAFLKWAFHQVVLWENGHLPENIIHIHGTRDPLFPISLCSPVNYIIPKGTHAMIRFRSPEIAEILKEELS